MNFNDAFGRKGKAIRDLMYRYSGPRLEYVVVSPSSCTFRNTDCMAQVKGTSFDGSVWKPFSKGAPGRTCTYLSLWKYKLIKYLTSH